MVNRTVLTGILAGLVTLGAMRDAKSQQPTSIGQQATDASGWTFNIAPYVWVPTIRTTLDQRLPPALDGKVPTEVSIGPGDVLRHLNFATAVAADAQYGRFSILSDFIYMNLSATDSHFRSVDFTGAASLPIARSAELSNGTSLNTTLWTLAGGYTLLEGTWGNFDVLAGFRLLKVNATTDFRLALTLTGPRGNGATFGGIGSLSSSDSIWNAIGGFRGRIRINQAGLFIPYYFDIGTGGSKLTWQIASGLGYQTGRVGVSLTYRYLAFEAHGDAVVQHLSMGGPMMMVNFTF